VSDDEFLVGCGAGPGDTGAAMMLAVRRVLAEVSGVSTPIIRADDPMNDRFWDSVDQLDITFRIEREMNVKLPARFFDTAVQLVAQDPGGLRVSHLARAAVIEAIPMKRRGAAR
jgi:acyl carrier protein